MKGTKWYKTTAIMMLGFLYIIGSFVVGDIMTAQIVKLSGPLPQRVEHVLSGLFGVIMMAAVVILIQYINHRKDKNSKYWKFAHSKLFTDTVDALKKIAQGDFNVLIAADEEKSPYNVLVESVNKMARELGSVDQLRKDFISNVSHEIQSPLTSISGYASLLKHEGVSRDLIVHYATIIETESKRLSKLSDNLLRLSALDAECTPMETQTYRLDKQLESILLMLEPQWADKKIIPEVSLPAITFTGNEDLLSQVWINLLHNAIKFSPENGSIRVSLSKNNDKVVCTISDNGIGIAPENQMHIFERFYKVDKSRNRSLGGNGLGLSLVKKIVVLFGGSITVNSAEGHGAEFTVTLPYQLS